MNKCAVFYKANVGDNWTCFYLNYNQNCMFESSGPQQGLALLASLSKLWLSHLFSFLQSVAGKAGWCAGGILLSGCQTTKSMKITLNFSITYTCVHIDSKVMDNIHKSFPFIHLLPNKGCAIKGLVVYYIKLRESYN